MTSKLKSMLYYSIKNCLYKLIFVVILSSFTLFGCVQQGTEMVRNPIMDGYFADPSIVKVGDTFYIFATIDPWGEEELAVFETRDFKSFEQKHINWPTKQACTSPESGDAKVWAPSVIKAPDGKFYMYVSVGSEIWAGTANHPLGPWKNIKEDGSPLISRNYFPGYHMIDAECFIDDDQQPYLYWGSGLNWINGRCFAVKLAKDMYSFDSKPEDITPPNFFEAPFMYKKNETYYLMYSDGKAIDPSYKIRYSTAKSPLGPWIEGLNSPILASATDSATYGPGHHSIFTENGQEYILYHRIFPQTEDFVLRQLCIDSLNFDRNGNIKTVHPKGVAVF